MCAPEVGQRVLIDYTAFDGAGGVVQRVNCFGVLERRVGEEWHVRTAASPESVVVVFREDGWLEAPPGKYWLRSTGERVPQPDFYANLTYWESMLGEGYVFTLDDGAGGGVAYKDGALVALQQKITQRDELDEHVKMCCFFAEHGRFVERVAALQALGDLARQFRVLPLKDRVVHVVAGALRHSRVEVHHAAAHAADTLECELGWSISERATRIY